MKSPVTVLTRGESFEWDGSEYIVLVDTLEFLAEPQVGVRKKGSSRPSQIPNALKSKLIKKAEGDLFSPERDETVIKKQPDTKRKKSKTAEEKPKTPAKTKIKTLSEKKRAAPFPTEAAIDIYIPVSSLRARVFLCHGLIFPASYDNAESKSFGDIQDEDAGALLCFLQAPLLDPDHFILTLSVLHDEISDLDRKRGTAVLTMPLPISRLKGIGVHLSLKELEAQIRGWTFPDIPVNESLFFSLTPAECKNRLNTGRRRHPSVSTNTNSNFDALSTYDRFLGMLSFARNSGMYLSNSTMRVRSIAPLINSLLMVISGRESDATSVIPVLLESLVSLHSSSQLGRDALEELVLDRQKVIEAENASPIMRSIYSSSVKSDALFSAFKCLTEGDYRSAIRKLQQADTPFEARVLAVLMNYGDRNSNDHRNVKQRLHDDWENDTMLSEVLAVLGARYGYTKLDAKEREIYSLHPKFAGLVPEQPDIKFHLRNNFERRLIETVYQRCFHDRPVPDGLFERFGWLPQAGLEVLERKDLPGGVIDESFMYEDLVVSHFSLRHEASIADLLLAVHPQFINESSETGIYLLHALFFHAEQYHLTRNGKEHSFGYRISANRAAEMLQRKLFSYNEDILRLCLQKDQDQ